MRQQIFAIAWAQFRITRNHLPRTSAGSVLVWLISAGWYGLFLSLCIAIAVSIPSLPLGQLRQWMPAALLAVLLFWQTVPLFTMSSGWSLQMNKLQIFPIPHSALFFIEVVLRITSAPEMLLVIAGGVIGLAGRRDLPAGAALLPLLFIPFNLFLQLAVRDFVNYAFERNRFREIFTILMVSVGVLPQIVLRTSLGVKAKPYFFQAARSEAMPWHEAASLSLGPFSWLDLALLLLWTAAAYLLARRQFNRGLLHDDAFRGGSPASPAASKPGAFSALDAFTGLFPDPLAALVQKEFQSLLRMPRVRVVLGMASFFSVIVFVPILLGEGQRSNLFSRNFFSIVNLYGLLILSDALLLNIFGFDRGAAQIYFAAPIPFDLAIKAKNAAACAFVLLQNLIVAIVTPVFVHVGAFSIAAGFAASAVITVFLLSAGNLLSVEMPRPIDPSSTFRKQAGAKVQVWMLLCSLGMVLLMGFAFLARWAFASDWGLFGVLALELAIGLICYRITMESAVALGVRSREQLVSTLSKNSAPVSSMGSS